MPAPMRWGAPPRGGGGGGSYRVLGVFIARPVAWLIATVIFMSAFGSLFERMGIPILRSSVLIVDEVWRGEVWRLVTWAPIELSALGLVFGCLLLYFIGPDLLHRWGTRRFFATFLGGAALVGALTCLIGRFLWADVARIPYMGLWPMEEAMIIAWAALFPGRQILVFFALPVFLPHFLAELAALVYMDVISVRPWIARARLAWFQSRYRRRTAKLSRVDRDEPPRWTH